MPWVGIDVACVVDDTAGSWRSGWFIGVGFYDVTVRLVECWHAGVGRWWAVWLKAVVEG